MAKKNIADNIFAFVPITTQTVLGTHIRGRANFMALGWLTRINFNPPMIAVGVNKNNASCQGIVDCREFSLNIPSADQAPAADYTGLVSARQADKSNLFEIFYGKLKSAPMIVDFPVNVECQVVQQLELPTNFCFIGEIVAVHAEEAVLTNDAPDPEKFRPLLLSMPDNRFWTLGECVGRAWNEGKKFREVIE
ncbi:MAG: flavin reductase family protein [Pseudomonadota bacterium]